MKFLVRKGQRAARLKQLSSMYDTGSATCDSDAGFHGILDALTHDVTYGGKSRADTTTNAWAQGASVDQTYTDQATAISPSVDNFRQMVDAIEMHSEGQDELLGLCGPSNFRRLKSQLEAQRIYEPGPLCDYGFSSMKIDDIEVVKEPWLENSQYNSGYATTKKYFFILNVMDFEYRIHPDRFFKMPPFVWQGNFPGGRDEWLTRILLAGDLVCWRPAGSVFRSDVW